jgi:uncharacterized protein (TIGR03663 family)
VGGMAPAAGGMAPAAEAPASRRAWSLDVRLSWELAAYATFAIVGGGMRLWDLGSRALHHDESLHAYYSWRILEGSGFQHDPLLHGPFQFFGTALTFFLTGGPSDSTARVLPALFGIALILLPIVFRGRLGRLGALFASGLIAFSPTLLYFSRFARNDIYIAVFMLGIVICLWRYVDERRPLFLYLTAALLALSFTAKENTFIHAAILLVFLNLWLAVDLARQTRGSLGITRPRRAAALGALYVPLAWAIAALWPFIGGLRRRVGLRELPAAGDLLIVLGTLSAPQLAAAVQVPLEAGGLELNTLGREQAVGVPAVLALLAATAIVGLGWNARVWLGVAAAFYVPYALLFTSFGTYGDGFGSGIWDSLDYWLDQHGVRRGDQPDWYYVTLLPVYEFLALAVAGPALLYYCLRGGPRSWLLTVIGALSLLAFFGADSFSEMAGKIAMPLALPLATLCIYFAVRGPPFERFLVFWTASAIVAYSWVGEKMPWLSVHTTLPVIILAAYSLGRLFEGMPSREEAVGGLRGLAARARPVVPFAAAGLGAAAAFAAAFWPGGGEETLRLALIAAAAVSVLALAPLLGLRHAGLAVVAAVFGGLALFSVRAGVVASFEHGDVPREMLIYVQTSPEVPGLRDRIDEIARTSGRGHDLPIIVDREFTWPWAWYLRDYGPRIVEIDDEFEPPEDAILLLGAPNEARVADYLDRYQEPQQFPLRWWFPERYRDVGRDDLWLALRDFGESLGRESTWDNWWRYFRHRQPPAPLGSTDSTAFIPSIYDPDYGPDVEGRLTIGASGTGEGQLLDPTGLAIDAEGRLYVADSGNGRVQLFDAEGQFVAAAGAPGDGEGQFNQPGDLALDSDGNVYVIDTWNHRVQVFDAELRFLRQWGKPARSLLDPADDELWGPRSLAVDGMGNVWVADTGTDRLLKFSPKGRLLARAGETGDALGELQEPVGVAIDPTTGDALVADVGNARIQRFDSDLAAIAVYPVAEWKDLDPANKPDLVVLPDGRLLAGDPSHGRILLIEGDGEAIASLAIVGRAALAFPRGLAYDESGGWVFVSEGTADRVRRFPLSDFALR